MLWPVLCLTLCRADGREITYHEDIEPLLQRHCLDCHHAAGDAPFSLEKFEAVVGWAAMIREVVRERRMPPWGASPDHGKFRNDRSLFADRDRLPHALDRCRHATRRSGARACPEELWPHSPLGRER
ncbi:MAG: hypothetical protein U1E76_14045 [Planctomycetota bacterium]